MAGDNCSGGASGMACLESKGRKFLAKQVSTTQGAIANIESGRMLNVSVDKFYDLSSALDVSCEHWRQIIDADFGSTAG